MGKSQAGTHTLARARGAYRVMYVSVRTHRHRRREAKLARVCVCVNGIAENSQIEHGKACSVSVSVSEKAAQSERD